ncbi:MAG: hypothetical protein GW754_04630 [Candidatus Pacebacteria bacterium]|nr:hypothetical protein [Candidatus Pacearchaeota archaeon]NCQ66097.1 hypothetical protein [Candidatus Paceibacterota bacterium]NCS86287.1 hypothetical protein [Candidatus Paceibacterota bacterium]PJC43513.1 MAG: hypothetical protein CO039_03670 [Candidatus Pacebacteria bacterium CG_4_9_14_0_2_um_filter_34_50]
MKKNFKKKKKLLLIFSLVILVAGLFAGIILVKQNQDINSEASGGCKGITSARECAKSCSPIKGKNNKSYKCAFRKDGCVETSKECDKPAANINWCPNVNGQLAAGQCGETQTTGASACLHRYTDNGTVGVLYCCPNGMYGYSATGNASECHKI